MLNKTKHKNQTDSKLERKTRVMHTQNKKRERDREREREREREE